MDSNQTIVHNLFLSYNDDQRSMLLDIIQGYNGSHETGVVYSNSQIQAYSCPANVPADQGRCYRDHLTDDAQAALHSQVQTDLTSAGYDFNWAKNQQGHKPDQPKPKHPKHGK
jgi:hypothetical protein